MDQARKQRPFVVIGTYDNYHQQQHQLESHPGEQSTTILADFDQSTDLFSYCRSAAQLNTNFNLVKKNVYHKFACCELRNQLTKLKLNLNLSQIKGPSGSVRGHKDVVRKSLENIRAVNSINSRRNFNSTNFQSFQSTPASSNQVKNQGDGSEACSSLLMHLDERHRAEYLERLNEHELGQCVAYTTSLGVIRRTFEDCKLLRSILNSNLIKYEERDIYLNQEYKKQLRLRCSTFQVPILFVDGKHFGGIKELELMNEDGKLATQLAQFKMPAAPKHVCYCCGNAKFIACQSCNGSRKSAVHHFKYNSIALRCIKCDENDGLVECPVCSSPFSLVSSASNLCQERQVSESGMRRDEDGRPTVLTIDANNNASCS